LTAAPRRTHLFFVLEAHGGLFPAVRFFYFLRCSATLIALAFQHAAIQIRFNTEQPDFIFMSI